MEHATAKEIAERYFELSNGHEMDAIAEMFTEETVYESGNTGRYVGRDAIMEMMRPFHESFEKLHWDIYSVEETGPDMFLFDFTMTGTKHTGDEVMAKGLEYVTMKDEKILQIEIRNK